MDKAREALYRLKWRMHHPAAFAKYAQILANEHASLDELLARQEEARQSIVRTAMTKTAFYPKFYGAVGFEVGDIGREGWFGRLPLVTKKELREQCEAFVNPEAREALRWFTTGGSTGEPVRTGFDVRLCEEVYNWRTLSRFGVHPWDNHAYLWRDLRPSRRAKLVNAALWWPTRHLKWDVSCLGEADIAAFLARCEKIRPRLVYGYVGALAQVAQYLLAMGRESGLGASFSPKMVWSTSAPLSGVQRRVIETAFGAPVCDEYGSCECRWLAAQCAECRGLHVNVEHVDVAFLDKGGREVEKGAYGRTVITNLEDEAFPLIRYENGDRGRWLAGMCACGRTLPCIDSVKGRESESFALPSGRVVSGEYLTTIFDGAPEIVRGFRVVQQADARIVVEYVAGAGREAEVRAALRGFEARVGGEVPVEVRRVAAIAHDRGKLRFVVKEK